MIMGGYKETWDNAASHPHPFKQPSGVGLGLVSGHGGGDDGDEEEVGEYEEAGIKVEKGNE